MKYCNKCGAELTDEAQTCPQCGNQLKSEDDNTKVVYVKPNGKSKIAAALLAIFVGTWGIHNFYLGYKTKGAVQLVLFISGLLTSVLGVGLLILLGLQMWVTIEFILILFDKITDSEGNELI